MSARQADTDRVVAQFGRLERRGVLLGLSGEQLGLVGAALFVLVAAVRGAGAVGVAVAAPVWVLLLTAALVTVHGRTVPAWTPVLAGWGAARASGRTRAASIQAGAEDVLNLPGIRGSLDLVACPAFGAVLVADRRSATVTAVARIQGSGILLADDGVQAHRTAGWGRVLASLAQVPSVVRVQVLTAVMPGGLSQARRWWRDHCTPSTPGPAAALADLLDAGFAGSSRREHLVAVAIRSPRGHRPLTADAVDAVAGVLSGVAQSLTGAELAIGSWLDEGELSVAIRRAYDPHATARAEDVPLRVASPVGVAEEWDRLRTGTAWHATYWVAEWPRTAVDATFLQPLLLGEVGTRTLSIVAEAVPAREALRQIRRARAEHRADAAQRQRIGQVEDRAVVAEVEDLDRREAELVAGHGDLRFSGLVSVSAPDRAGLDDACRSVESDAARAMCDLVRLVGQQGAGHLASALPLARGVR
ncbi:SCO6880 family protein [Actinotalea subterranea]|uniref:SCO6880 family protein n=1 Tax=Actinotalea subterranea TaxID=2607497 RepID=UPI0011EC05F2|nr:SCO6880 family protein [Actinotalea subterranea]